MATRLIWLPEAAADLDAIAAYIGSDAPGYASDFVGRVILRAETLIDFPRSGHVTPELGDDDVREVSVYPYRLVYRLRGNALIVIAVLHGSRLLESELRKRLNL